MRRPRTRWRVLRVSGPSMVPTLRHGDVVVARIVGPGARGGDVNGGGVVVGGVRGGDVRVGDVRVGDVRVGDVVVGRYRSMPERLVVKTVAAAEGDGWLLASDNPGAGGDSSVHGVADVLARVVVRLRGASRPHIVRRRPT